MIGHPEDMDPTCKPCTDFWRYVNGGWLDKNPVPADKRNWGPIGVLTAANRERNPARSAPRSWSTSLRCCIFLARRARLLAVLTDIPESFE